MALSARQQLAGFTDEKHWQRTVEEAVEQTGWTWMHVPPSRVVQKGNARGKWATTAPRGFPDVLALRAGHLLVIEAKVPGRYPKPHQRLWLEQARLVPCSRVWVSRPSDEWEELVRWLRHPQEAPAIYGWTPRGVEDALRRVAEVEANEARRRAGQRAGEVRAR